MDADGSSMLTGAALILMIIIIRGFFTVCETALIDINDGRVRSFEKSTDKAEQTVFRLLRNPLRLMTAFSCIRITTAALAAFTAANYFYRPLTAVLDRTFSPESEYLLIAKVLSVIIITMLIVMILSVFTDGIPRRITAFSGNAEKTAVKFASFVHGTLVFLAPLSIISEKLIILFSAAFGIDKTAERELVTEEEIMLMVDAGNETGVIEEAQREMINNVFEFDDLPVSEVMTHRTDITAVDTNAKISELVYLAINSGFSRIPVYKDTIDRIVGIICVKDLLCLVGNDSADSISVTDFMRDAIYFPETGHCGVLFKKMTAEKTQLSVIVDEYGGTAGIVSIEDLVESIVGSIQDEYDNETEDIIKISDTEYAISGTAAPDEIMEKLGVPLPEDSEFDTMSGFMTHLLGHIPEENEMPSAVYGNVRLTALITEDMRITRIKAEILDINNDENIKERSDKNEKEE